MTFSNIKNMHHYINELQSKDLTPNHVACYASLIVVCGRNLAKYECAQVILHIRFFNTLK